MFKNSKILVTGATGLIGRALVEKLKQYNPAEIRTVSLDNDQIEDTTHYQYDLTDKLAYSVDLIEAYPIAVNQLDLDWSNDGHHKLVVVFAYTYWNVNTTAQPILSPFWIYYRRL